MIDFSLYRQIGNSIKFAAKNEGLKIRVEGKKFQSIYLTIWSTWLITHAHI
jgi:hypothetical protein